MYGGVLFVWRLKYSYYEDEIAMARRDTFNDDREINLSVTLKDGFQFTDLFFLPISMHLKVLLPDYILPSIQYLI